MGRVFGENFPKFVDQQIKVRQNKLGNKSKFSQNYSIDSRQSFMRMISSVDIDDKIKNNLGIKVDSGNTLAKSFILQNGVTNIYQDQSTGFKNSISLSPNTPIPRYGWGGLDQGFRPQPFIETIKITSKNNGSLREATINIKAFTKTQFQVIDSLYMRLGYSVLLEWGNITYLNNSNKKSSLGDDYLGLKYKLLSGGQTLKDLHKLIFDQTKASSGNYDGFIGKVTNFSWQFTPEGVYDITVDLITYGDIIESLNVNTLGGVNVQIIKKPEATTAEEQEEQDEENKVNILNQAGKNSLGFYIAGLVSPYIQGEVLDFISSDPFSGIYNAIGSLYQDSSLFNPYNSKDFFCIKQETFLNNAIDEFGNTFYIRLGALLELIQNGSISTVPGFEIPAIVPDNCSQNKTTLEKTLNIDFDNSSNFCMFRPGLFSSNPYVCIVGGYTVFQRPLFFKDEQYYVNSFKLNPTNADDNNYLGYTNYGKTMNIYINALRFLEIIQENVDDKGNSSLFEVLKKLCTEINESLCNVTDLEPKYNEFTNSLEIVDNKFISTSVSDKNIKSLIKPKSETSKDIDYAEEPTEIIVYGGHASGNAGTTLRTFELKTELSKDLATTIAIGAQASEDGQSVPNEKTTHFMRFNEGYVDRIAPKKIIKTNKQTNKVAAESIQEQKQQIYDSLSDILDYVTIDKLGEGSYSLPDKESISSWSGTLKSFFELQDYEKRKNIKTKGALPGTGIIPINLSFTMDGIGGIKIFETFKADLSFLPQGYETVTFIVKGINHEIQNNDWITTIETNMVPSKINSEEINEESAPSRRNIISTGLNSATSVTVKQTQIKDCLPITRPLDCPIINFKTDDLNKRVSTTEMIKEMKLIFPQLPKNSIAGMLGVIKFESQFNPTAYNEPTTCSPCGAIGFCQWVGSRQRSLFKYATLNKTTPDQSKLQLQFLRKELVTSYKNVWNLLNDPKITVLQATAIFHISFGLGNSDPYKYYNEIINIDNYKKAYKDRDGKSFKSIPVRYNDALNFRKLI